MFPESKIFKFDGISKKILKMCISLIIKLHSYICNKSIQTGVFRDHLKNLIVKTLYKNGYNICILY